MAEPPKSRKTGEHNGLLVKLMADGAAMREQIDALEARILRLEAQVATMRAGAAPAVAVPGKTAPRLSAPPPDAPRPNKRPGGLGPPPLPRLTGSMGAVKPGRKSMSIDVSDIAELVDSMPPPAPRSKK
jgi:hypothetical protein